MPESEFCVSICGGGIGGLTLAVVIAKYGMLPVEIFEAGPTITTYGAGVGFYARSMEIMKQLGLYDEIVKMAIEPPEKNTSPNFRKSDQRDGHHWFTRNVNGGCLLVHRKDVIDCLLRQIPASCKIHTSKRLEFYDIDSETGKIVMHFSDGSRANTDVLVGADGIRSATRKSMYQTLASLASDDDAKQKSLECVSPVWTGNLAYRYVFPAGNFLKKHPRAEMLTELTLFLGKKKHIVMFPICQGRLINVVIHIHNREAFGTPFEDRWVVDVSEKEILDQFDEWEVCARALVKCAEKPSRWAIHSTRPLPQYVSGRVALLGDAAHAMEPHLGAGAGQAMEDALVLGRLLTHELTHKGNLTNALKTYEEVRLPFANSVVQQSRDMGLLYGLHLNSVDGPVLDPNCVEELEHVRTLIESGWEWQNEPACIWAEAEGRWRAKYNMTPNPLVQLLSV